jgi:predicted transcriptional regulator
MMRWLKTPNMADRRLGPLERQLLRALWGCGDATVRELLESKSASSAYTTVMTTLDRLYKKGLLERTPDGRAFRYRPAVSEEEFNRTAAAVEVERLLSSAAHPAMPLSFLVDTVTRHDTALLDELQRVLDRKRRALRKEEKP